MAAVAVTEPDFGSDVAGIKVTAAAGPTAAGVINGVKTWCTFAARADVLMLLARTDPDRSRAHRGLSMFIVPKPQGDGTASSFDQAGRSAGPGRGAARGAAHRHPRLPGHALLRAGLRRLVGARRLPDRRRRRPRAGASTSRWRASRTAGCRPRPGPSGVMQAAYEAARDYAANRVVFGRPVGDYQLTAGQAGPDGRRSSRPAASSCTRWPG